MSMHEPGPPIPAERADVVFAVWFAVRDLPKRADAHAAAEAVVATLERQGFVILRKPPARMCGTPQGK